MLFMLCVGVGAKIYAIIRSQALPLSDIILNNLRMQWEEENEMRK